MLTKDTKLRFWCQKVLPLVYDDSLSYYELLNKVVLHLNQHTEDINALIDFYDTFSEDVEDIIRQMMDDGEFNEIVADTIGSMIAAEYDPEQQYIIFDYCVYNSKLYRANGSTTGEFDPEKWDERSVGYDLTTIQNYIYSLNAGNVAYDPTATYDSGTVGNKIKNLNANDIAFGSSETYDNDTVGKELIDVNNGLLTLGGQIAPVENGDTSSAYYTTGQYILRNNLIYTVIAQIDQGDTFIVGTNIALAGSITNIIYNGRTQRVYCGKFTTDNVTQVFDINKLPTQWHIVFLMINNNAILTSPYITELTLSSTGSLTITRTGTGIWAGTDVYAFLRLN